MLREKLVEMFNKVQQSSWTHQRCKQQLANLYKSFLQTEFLNEFVRCLTCIFIVPIQSHSPGANRVLTFAAEFVAKFVTSDEGSDSETSNSAEDESYAFVSGVLQEVLDYHDAIDVNVRYRVVQFVALFLHKIPDNAHLTVNDWNAIEKVMLELMEDKAAIRAEAVKCLVRLQQPSDVACPVTATYLSAIYDPNPLVRKEIVSSIHASAHTIPKIVERVRDTDHKVRLEVYKRCAQMGPRILKLSDRQHLLDAGFHEGHANVRQYFVEQMLPRWLTSYNGSLVALLNALKLDASEEDIRSTETLWEKVLKELFKSVPLMQIIDDLSLGEDRLIPVEKLCPETATLWSNLVQHVKVLDGGDNYIDAILPELLPFTMYIKNVLKRKNADRMQTWEYLAHQQVVSKLFQIVQTQDLAEEIGRQAVRKLLNNTIKYEKLSSQVLRDMFVIFENLQPNGEQLIEEVALLIHEILEQEVSKPVQLGQDLTFELAQVQVKIAICTDELEEAVRKEDFEKAAQIKNTLDLYNKELEERSNVGVRIEKVVRDDLDTVCKFLDVLIVLLSKPKLCTLLPILLSIKDELVEPLLKHEGVEVQWRVLKCLSLFALLDRNFAAENVKLLCAPLIIYHTSATCIKQVLLVSARAATDMFRLFGGALFGENSDATQNTTAATSTRRRLFRMSTDHSSMELAKFGCDDIVEILVGMLDDEDDKIVETGGKCLRSLVITGTVSSPTLMARLILKWLNPVVEKHHPMLSQLLINTIIVFAREGKNSDEVLEQAVLPVLTQIGTAPKTSPLSDTNTNDVVNFLAVITSLPDRPNMFVKTHYNIAHALCDKMAKQPTDCCVSLYIKMMMKLRFHPEETVSNADLAKQIDLILPQIKNKKVGKSVAKLVAMLKDVARVNETEVSEGAEGPQSDISRQSNEEEEVVNGMRDLNVHNNKKQASKKDRKQTERPNDDSTQAAKKNRPGTASKEKMPLQVITNNTQMRLTRSSSASRSSSQGIGADIRNEIEAGEKTLLVNVILQDLDKMASEIKKKRKRRRRSASSGNSREDSVTSGDGDETVLHAISENESEFEILTSNDGSLLSSSQRSSLESSRVTTNIKSADTRSPPRKARRSTRRKRKQIHK